MCIHMDVQFVAPLVDAPGSQGGSCCERAGCRPPLGPSQVPRLQGFEVSSGVHREGRRAGPPVVDGTCAQETEQHPPGLKKKEEEKNSYTS